MNKLDHIHGNNITCVHGYNLHVSSLGIQLFTLL